MSRKQSAVMVMAQQMCDALLREQTFIRTQMMKDVAMIAANDVLGLGPGRAVAFSEAYDKTANEIAELFITDGEDDEKLWYAKQKLDERLKAIVGEENFVPYDDRYGKKVKFGKDRVREDKEGERK